MKHVVIIGNSAAGISAAEQLRALDTTVSITMISDETMGAYRRYELARLLSKGVRERDLEYRAAGWYSERAIDLRLNTKVESINLQKQSITCANKTKIGYDALIIASGMQAELPKELKGTHKHGVLGFRTIEEVRDLTQLLPITTTVCVYGAGIAGVRAAEILAARGIEVKMIVPDHVLPGILDATAGAVVEHLMQRAHIQIMPKRTIVEIYGDSDVKAVKLDSGKVIGCGMVIADHFYAPRIRFLEGTELYQPHGIAVNPAFQSSVATVFAAGDVVQQGVRADSLTSWDRAVQQGRVAAENCVLFLRGASLSSSAMHLMLAPQEFSLCGVPCAMAGTTDAESAIGAEVFSAVGEQNASFKKIVCRDGKMIGYCAVADVQHCQTWNALLEKQITITPHIEQLFSPHGVPFLLDSVTT